MRSFLCWECPDDREHCEETGHYNTRTVAHCHCGEKVLCDSFTNTCNCGQEFNRSAQPLKPRDQWHDHI